MSRIRAVVAAGCALGAWHLGGCQFIGGISGIEYRPDDSAGGAGVTSSSVVSSSASSGGAGGSGGAAPTCDSRTTPVEPAEDGTGGSPPGDLVFALRRIGFSTLAGSGGGGGGSVGVAGFDLDGTCSVCDGNGSLLGPPSKCQVPDFFGAYADTGTGSPDARCDDANGTDNGMAAVLGPFEGIFPLNSASASQAAADGAWSMLMRVEGYNGTPNDKTVSISIYGAASYESCNCGSPNWDGQDSWPVFASSLTNFAGGQGGAGGFCQGTGGNAATCMGVPAAPEEALYRDTEAFVRDGMLVGSLTDTAFFIEAGDVKLPVILSQSVVAMPLTEGADGVWRIDDGVLAGYWHLPDLFDLIGRITTNGDSLCTNQALYPLIKDQICRHVDSYVGTLQPETKSCNAVSFGWRIDMVQAQLGFVTDSPTLTPNTCDPGRDPGDDECANILGAGGAGGAP